jgi:hypothetical protein
MPNIAALAWYSLIALKPAKQESALFWLIVAVPPFLIYAMRVAFPDVSFDEHNYHLLSAERGLRGLPFTSADFFPAPGQIQFRAARTWPIHARNRHGPGTCRLVW